jgi:hypothetical protein
MTGITTYLSILTLNVNGLNSPSKDTIWKTGLKRKIQNLLPKGDPYHQQKLALAESERLEQYIPIQWPLKTGRGSNTYLRQTRLHTYIDQMR